MLSNERPLLNRLQYDHFRYFIDFRDTNTGLVLDRSTKTSPASIAATGFGLVAYLIGYKKGWLSQEKFNELIEVLINTLIDIQDCSTFCGWWYHFLEPSTGLPITEPSYWNSEVSTIDTVLLLAGLEIIKSELGYKTELCNLIDQIVDSVDWVQALSSDQLFSHGWDYKLNKINHCYQGYSEALLLYIFALGADKSGALDRNLWVNFTKSFYKDSYADIEFISMPGTPLFCYLYPHCFIDFKSNNLPIGNGEFVDFFLNSQKLIQAQQRYALNNPKNFKAYSELEWGFSASDGPGYIIQNNIQFYGYHERGAPYGIDDGTICPVATLAATMFDQYGVIKMINHLINENQTYGTYGFYNAYNKTFSLNNGYWIDPEYVGIDHGAAVLMLENYLSKLVWQISSRSTVFSNGLSKIKSIIF